MGVRVSVALLLAVVAVPDLAADTMYISDEMTVPVRSGPSGGHRIVHRGLPSGTRLEVLSVDETSGFSEVRSEGGTEGWIRSQYLVSEPIAKLRLAASQREVAALQRQLNQAQAQIRELSSTAENQSEASAERAERIAALEAELAEIQRISESAVATHEENQKLHEINARLQGELDDAAEVRDRLESNAANEGIMLGAGFVLLGLIAGVLIKSRPQRSAWS